MKGSLNKTFILAKREFFVRIRSKGFWIGTLILPLFMAVLFAVPALIFSSSTSQLDLVMVDATGRVGEAVAARMAERRDDPGSRIAQFSIDVVAPAADRQRQRDELDERLLGEEIDAWVWLDRAGLENDRVEYRARSVSNTFSQDKLEDEISAAVREMRLTEAGYDPQEIRDLIGRVRLSTVRVSAEGSREEAGEAGFILAYGLFFLLYMVLLLWGQQVLQGVLEEKSSRVVEIVVSAARPFDLMLGKLLGIGAAALTQFSIWMVTLVVLTAPGLISSLASAPDLNLPSISAAQALFVVVFFLLGFFVYSSMYAAVGSAFNNLQEAQQLSFVPTAAIILPMFFLLPVINDSNGTLAVITSMVPFLSPILMPLRIAVLTPPLWQVLLSIVITAAFVLLMVWVCARIYRTGILMYGKKPTFKELIKWLSYS